VLIVAVIIVALGFDYTNGFHDAANAIATSVSTRALTPRAALAMAAVMNLIGAFLGTGVAQTVGSGIVELPETEASLVVLLAALLGAITWNLITWWLGLPSSSSHALIGGLVGATLAAVGTVKWAGIFHKVVIPMIVSPLVGFTLAFLLMTAIMWGSDAHIRGGSTAGFGLPRRSAPRRWRSDTGCRTLRRRWT
jgi:PiT family inorganic phosphate transporter